MVRNRHDASLLQVRSRGDRQLLQHHSADVAAGDHAIDQRTLILSRRTRLAEYRLADQDYVVHFEVGEVGVEESKTEDARAGQAVHQHPTVPTDHYFAMMVPVIA